MILKAQNINTSDATIAYTLFLVDLLPLPQPLELPRPPMGREDGLPPERCCHMNIGRLGELNIPPAPHQAKQDVWKRQLDTLL